MTDYLPIALLAAVGLVCSVALLASGSPLLLGLTALTGTSVGMYLADRLGVPPNLIKIYLSVMFGAAFVLLGRVPQFRTELWEYLLLLFFVGRVLLDLARPDFELRYPFGGVGDGLFLTSTYFYFKKAFLARAEIAASVLRAVIYCSVVIAGFGLCEAVTGMDLFTFTDPRFIIEGRHRANSIFLAPEYFGAAMSLTTYLALLLYWSGRLRGLGLAVISTLLLLATVASLYRGIWLAFVAGLVFLFVTRAGGAGQLRVPLRLVTSVVVVAVMAFSAQALLKNTAIYEQRIANAENVHLRIKVYAAIARGVTDHPWLGYGTGTVDDYLAVTPYNPTELNTPHNGYLSIAFENGVVFLVIYLGWLIALLWRVRETNSPTMLVAGAMVTMVLVTDMTMHFPLSFDYHSLLVMMTAALAVAERDALADMAKPVLHPIRRPARMAG